MKGWWCNRSPSIAAAVPQRGRAAAGGGPRAGRPAHGRRPALQISDPLRRPRHLPHHRRTAARRHGLCPRRSRRLRHSPDAPAALQDFRAGRPRSDGFAARDLVQPAVSQRRLSAPSTRHPLRQARADVARAPAPEPAVRGAAAGGRPTRAVAATPVPPARARLSPTPSRTTTRCTPAASSRSTRRPGP